MADGEDLSKLFKDIEEQSEKVWEEFFKSPKVYRKRPDIFRAIQFREDTIEECIEFTQGQLSKVETDEGIKGRIGDYLIPFGFYVVLNEKEGEYTICSEQEFNLQYECYSGWL